jgi:rfaE bifunctional protein nucleotidyltransferase chain/domain/rfaE bifunctional protein kinase chain/domain
MTETTRDCGVRLLVIGDTLLDRDVMGRVERVCPDAPVPVVDVTAVRERPGGAGLAALLAARQGVSVVLATGLGGPAGDRARELLCHDVQVHDVRPGTPTVSKTRVRAHGQSLLRIDDAAGALGDGSAERAAHAAVDVPLLRSLFGRCDAVLVSDYGGPLTRDPAVRSAVEAHVDRLPVVWDPHPRGAGPVTGVAVSTPNRAEARHFVGCHGTDGGNELRDLAATLRLRWGARAVCVTDGERGAVTALRDDQVVVTPALRCPDGTDTCGAGDRFAGSLAGALARGFTTEDAVAEAQNDVGHWLRAGGVATLPQEGERAAIPPGGRDAAVTLSASTGVSPDELVEKVRRRGGTVVATGGCFDVLHAGHLALLEHARSLGDCLVVLLNSDASVRRLKGPTRPVHRVPDRARLLEGLACVDAVVVFEDDDPVATLARLRPDVWVKGGDYREEDLPEARTVRALGGRIALMPYLNGHSTSQILQHLNRAAATHPARRTGPAAPMSGSTRGDSR